MALNSHFLIKKYPELLYNGGMKLTQKAQATIEYVIALVMTVIIVAIIVDALDLPVRKWWDTVARRIAAPCPSKECAKSVDPIVKE